MVLEGRDGFKTNSVFWLRSLSEKDQGPTRRVLEDLEPFLKGIGLPLHLIDVYTTADLYYLLDQLALAPIKPILQLDMHGEKQGLTLARSGELAPWSEVVPRLRNINLATQGNLCVVAGVCYAYYALTEISISNASPVKFLIAPDREIGVGILEDGLVSFYKALFSGLDISEAQSRYLADPMKLFHAEKFFVIALCKYIRESCKGKGGAARREHLLTEILLNGRPRNTETLRELREPIREGIKPSQQMVDRYAKMFLIGRPCPFSIDELLEAVEHAATNNSKAHKNPQG
jgi:hypothetical protein